jgi:hypothetical protein
MDSSAPRPVVAIIASIVWGSLLFPGLLGAALSPMFFDAPGSMNNPGAWINLQIVVLFPILCILSIAGSWLVWLLMKRSGAARTTLGVAIAALPVLPIAYFVVAMVVETVGVLVSGQPLGLHSTIIQR